MGNLGDTSWRQQEVLQRRKAQLQPQEGVSELWYHLTSLDGTTGLQEGMREELVWNRDNSR